MLKYMLEGGPLMWVLLGLSMLGLGVIIDRWKVFRSADVDTSVMRRMILQLLSAGKTDDAIRLCEETRGPVAAILLVGIDRYGDSPTSIGITVVGRSGQVAANRTVPPGEVIGVDATWEKR